MNRSIAARRAGACQKRGRSIAGMLRVRCLTACLAGTAAALLCLTAARPVRAAVRQSRAAAVPARQAVRRRTRSMPAILRPLFWHAPARRAAMDRFIEFAGHHPALVAAAAAAALAVIIYESWLRA